ncbi:hypothetical protein [Hydrogenimonas sp.]
MADAQIDISEKIAEQIEKIAKESLEINLKILHYLKEDLDEIRQLASERGIPLSQLLLLILQGIKKGLVRSGKVSAEEIKKIVDLSSVELPRLLTDITKKGDKA